MKARMLLIEDFKRARREAEYLEFMSRVTGKSARLLSYEEVKRKLRAVETSQVELKDIPVDAIVGSVGRYGDFTRNFLPRMDSDVERWISVMQGMERISGLPPIEVYQVGSAYFVLDGNHRVSVARRIGAPTIHAYVRQVQARVPFSPGENLETLINKAEYAEFLEKTHLDELRPGTNFQTTLPGRHMMLLQQIEVMQFLMEMEANAEVPYQQAVLKWHDEVYDEMVQAIRRRNALASFPGRTETDLFTWLVENSAVLGRELGWQVKPQTIVPELIARFNAPNDNLAARLWDLFLGLVTLGRDGERVGMWREERLADFSGRLFRDILVVGTPEAGWSALGTGLYIAQNEICRVLGLYVQPSPAEGQDVVPDEIEEAFRFQCDAAAAWISNQVVVQNGSLAELLKSRGDWVDLVILPYRASGPLSIEAYHPVLRQAQTPVLLVPGEQRPPKRGLLIFDGTPRSKEALFLGAYLYSFWGMDLVVGAIARPEAAREYLEEHKIPVVPVHVTGEPGEALLALAAREQCDLLVMGSALEDGQSWADTLVSGTLLPVLVCN